jgi:hypothetical protein
MVPRGTTCWRADSIRDWGLPGAQREGSLFWNCSLHTGTYSLWVQPNVHGLVCVRHPLINTILHLRTELACWSPKHIDLLESTFHSSWHLRELVTGSVLPPLVSSANVFSCLVHIAMSPHITASYGRLYKGGLPSRVKVDESFRKVFLNNRSHRFPPPLCSTTVEYASSTFQPCRN